MSETTTETIQHFEFDYIEPCEHPMHGAWHEDQPAMFLIHSACRRPCGYTSERFLCLSGWERAGWGGVKCSACGDEDERDEVMRIVRVTGSAS